MQLSADVRSIFASKAVKPEDCKLTWTFTVDANQPLETKPEDEFGFIVERPDGTLVKETPPGPLTTEEIAEVQKQVWLYSINKGTPEARPKWPAT